VETAEGSELAAPSEVIEECPGIYWGLGDVEGPCGMKGASLSATGGKFLGSVFAAIGAVIKSVMPED